MVATDLFPSDENAADRAMIFDQYKLAVEMWDRVRARRQHANAFYVTVNAALIGAAAVKDPKALTSVAAAIKEPDAVVSISPALPLYLSLAGLAVCALWFATILLYKSLTDDKLRIICRLEQRLPCSPFRAEAIRIANGTEDVRTRPFTRVERIIPVVYAGLYATVLVRILFP